MTISLLQNLIPRFYKKTFFIGKLRVFKFTKEYTKKFLHRAIFLLLLATIVLTMIFGSIAMMFGSSNNSQRVITIPTK